MLSPAVELTRVGISANAKADDAASIVESTNNNFAFFMAPEFVEPPYKGAARYTC